MASLVYGKDIVLCTINHKHHSYNNTQSSACANVRTGSITSAATAVSLENWGRPEPRDSFGGETSCRVSSRGVETASVRDEGASKLSSLHFVYSFPSCPWFSFWCFPLFPAERGFWSQMGLKLVGCIAAWSAFGLFFRVEIILWLWQREG